MGKELFETLPDVLDAKLLASALSISKAGAYQLLNRPDFPTLQVGGRKLVTKQKLALWMEQHTNKAKQAGAGKEKKADESGCSVCNRLSQFCIEDGVLRHVGNPFPW